MVDYNKFVADDKRAYREVLIFELINTANNDLVPDSAVGDESYEKTPLTIAQKKRLRNQVYRNAYYAVEQFNAELEADKAAGLRLDEEPKSVNDTDVIVDAFFETGFGKEYAKQKSTWQEGGELREKFEPRIHAWTDGKTDKDAIRWAISPYDPRFAGSSLFDDADEDLVNDDLGYIVGKFTDDGKRLVNTKGVPVASSSTLQRQNDTIVIHSLYLGNTQEIVPPTDEFGISQLEPKKIEGKLEASGYAAIRHYIKDKDSADTLRKALEDQMNMPKPGAQPRDDGTYAPEDTYGPMSNDEFEFMHAALDYLTEKGLDFEVVLDRQNKLAVKVNDSVRTQIRLIDREEPKYQGRIYSKNTVSYLNASNKGGDNLIRNQDRMTMLRWYFGESVNVDTEDFKELYKPGSLKVGQHKIVNHRSLGQNHGAVALVKRNTGGNSVNTSSICVALRATTNGKWKNLRNVDIITSQQNDGVKSDNSIFAEDNVVFSVNAFENSDTYETKIKPRIPVEKAYPSDTHMEDGVLVLNDSLDSSHYEYYRRLMVREKLADWLDTSKENFAKMVDVDGLIEAYKTYVEFPDTKYQFSDDERVKAIQEHYWEALTGKISAVSTALNAEDAPESSFIDCGTTIEQKTSALHEHFDRYSDLLFGSVPELEREGIDVHNKSMGFRPSMIAQYLNNDENVNIARTYDYMKGLLNRLREDYNNDYILEGEYADNQIKNDLIRFDENRIVGTVSYSMLAHGDTLVPTKIEKLKNSPEFRNKPVTCDMLIHTMKSLAESGFVPDSISVSVDENGIIRWSGAQETKKFPGKKGEDKNGNEIYKFDDYDPNANYPRGTNTKSSDGKNFDFIKVSGYIGQIFEPDRYGAIHTNYAVPDDKVLIPGYDAFVVPEDAENPAPMRDRLRLVGWEQSMKTAISEQIHNAAFSYLLDYEFLPHGTDLNYVYRHSYDTTFSERDYKMHLPRYADSSRWTPEERTFVNVLQTLKGRCRFPNEYGDGATTMAQSMLEHPDSEEAKNFDFHYSDLVDNENLRVLGEFFDGVFDENMTATAKNQGIVRYLVSEATVNNETGKVTPAPRGRGHRKPQCALMKDSLFKEKYFDTWDRRLMASTQVLTALHTPRNVGVAMMNFKGWNFDDGFLVSKKFAEENSIIGKDGNLRPLIAQDKLSDMHGNKGVISKVIDPYLATDEIVKRIAIDYTHEGTVGHSFENKDFDETWVLLDGKSYHVTFDGKSDESYETQAAHQIQKAFGCEGMDDIMHAFRDNPKMDVVMAPYSTMSRFNGGSIRQLMNPDVEHGYEVQDIKVGSQTFHGALSFTDLVVVDMPADVKTHFYDKEAIASGQGRKASSQLAWALQSKRADAIMKEFYGNNDTAINNLREYAISLGLDFDEDMKPVVGYQPQLHRGEKRSLLKLVDEDTLSNFTFKESALKSGKVYFDDNIEKTFKAEMLERLNASGGFMELPFPLEFKTLEYSNKNTSQTDNAWFVTQKTGQNYVINGEAHDTYGMPILPQNLRCGQDFLDGTAQVHEYTTKYLDIYRNAIMYMACQKALSTETDDARKALFEKKMADCVSSAQSKFDEVTKDIANNKFNTKYNVVREEVMANRIAHSATAVWSADPRLDINQVSMNSAHAKLLGLCDKDGNLNAEASVLVWRDPILHDGNVRYLRVTIDESITGVAINPLMDQSFDGDFDGDSVAIVPLMTPEAQKQAYSLFAVENNLLNKGVKDANGNYPIYCQSGLDVASNAYADPKIKTKFNELTVKINEIEHKAEALAADPTNEKLINSITYETTDKTGKKVTLTGERAINRYRRDYRAELNDWAHVALEGIGTDYIDFTDDKSVMRSLQHIVDTGAKGSQKKLLDAADNMGIHYECGADKRVDLDTVRSLTDKTGKIVSRATLEGIQRQVDKAIQETAAYKADNTALGGTIAQHGVSAFRDVNLTAALELTYPVTQAILQSKHDPKDAKVKDEIVRYWGKDCWNGYKLTGDWTNSEGLSPDDFAKKLQTQKHQRIKTFVLDPDGNKIPVKKRVPRLAADGSPLYDNGQQLYDYVEKTDRRGNIIYETTYEKCTKEEFVSQMKGMFTAFKVDINADYLNTLAEEMVRKTPAPIMSTQSNNSKKANVVFYADSSNGKKRTQKPVMGNKGTVTGLEDFADERGTLLDSVAYFNRMSAVVTEALKSYAPYVENVRSSRFAFTLDGNGPRSILTDGITKGVDVKELEQKRALLPRTPKTDEEKAKLNEIRSSIKEIRGDMCCSSSFTPDFVVSERYGDKQRQMSGSDKNTFVKVKRGVPVTYESAPKPIGCRGSFLREEDFNAGATYMGETQEAYSKRVGLSQPATPDVTVSVAKETTVVDTKPVITFETPVVEKAEASVDCGKGAKPINRESAVNTMLGDTVDSVKQNSSKSQDKETPDDGGSSGSDFK